MTLTIHYKDLAQHSRNQALMFARGHTGISHLLTLLIALKGWAQDDNDNGPCDHREVTLECTFDEDYCIVEKFEGPEFLAILFGEELPDFIGVALYEKHAAEQQELYDQRRIDAAELDRVQ